MTLSSFRLVPRRGHLDRAKRICCYLARMKHAVIRFRTEEPDYSDLPTLEYDCERPVYGSVTKDIPSDAPRPLGKCVTVTHYVDANLYHCMLTQQIRHWRTASPEPMSNRLVLQEAGHRGNCNLWFRVCRSSHLCGTSHGSPLHPQISGRTHLGQEHHVRRQQICC
jgi:hypothetical protein